MYFNIITHLAMLTYEVDIFYSLLRQSSHTDISTSNMVPSQAVVTANTLCCLRLLKSHPTHVFSNTFWCIIVKSHRIQMSHQSGPQCWVRICVDSSLLLLCSASIFFSSCTTHICSCASSFAFIFSSLSLLCFLLLFSILLFFFLSSQIVMHLYSWYCPW